MLLQQPPATVFLKVAAVLETNLHLRLKGTPSHPSGTSERHLRKINKPARAFLVTLPLAVPLTPPPPPLHQPCHPVYKPSCGRPLPTAGLAACGQFPYQQSYLFMKSTGWPGLAPAGTVTLSSVTFFRRLLLLLLFHLLLVLHHPRK